MLTTLNSSDIIASFEWCPSDSCSVANEQSKYCETDRYTDIIGDHGQVNTNLYIEAVIGNLGFASFYKCLYTH